MNNNQASLILPILTDIINKLYMIKFLRDFMFIMVFLTISLIESNSTLLLIYDYFLP